MHDFSIATVDPAWSLGANGVGRAISNMADFSLAMLGDGRSKVAYTGLER
jgi:hypothetical protein